jgi:hypothetical protein
VVSITPRPPLLPGKDPVPIVQEAGWAPEPLWIGAENLAPPGFDPRTFQSVASRYTDWAILAPADTESEKKVEYKFPVEFEVILIYLLTAIGLPPGGSCTVHIYTQTIHRTTQNKQYIEQHKNKQYKEQHKYGRVRAVPRLCELYPGICLTTEEKARKNLSNV